MRILIYLFGMFAIVLVACSGSAPTANEPTPNIDATVEARAKELVAAQATAKPTSTEVATPMPTNQPTVTSAPTPTPTPTPTSVLTGDWVTETSVNPMDDSTTVTAMLAAHEGKGIYGDDIYIVLRCKNHDVDVLILWESYLGSDDPQITTRIGDGPAQTMRWDVSTDNQTSFSKSPELLIDSLSLAGDRYVAQVVPYGESPITAVFNLTGIEKAAEQVTDNCSNSIQSTTPDQTAAVRELPISGTISPPVSSQTIQSSIDNNWSLSNNRLIWTASYRSPSKFFPNGADVLSAKDSDGWHISITSTPLPTSVRLDSLGVSDSSVAKIKYKYLERARIILLALNIDQSAVDSLILMIDSDLTLVEGVSSLFMVGPYLVISDHLLENKDWGLPDIFELSVYSGSRKTRYLESH
jgi:hypothetical protein